ncbi:MAG TPA: hypothetical protein VGG39_27625 [Polyangiaceae bacterium]
MPKSTGPPPKDLDEVERALSVLQGRHPEHERSRRETLAAAAERREVLAGELAARSRKRRRRAIVLGVIVVALGAVAVVGWKVASRARAIRSALGVAEAPFVGHGMKEVVSNELSAASRIEADAAAGSCFVAVATNGTVHAQQGTTDVTGTGSAGWCTCEAGHVSVEGETGGLALLRIDARELGGPLARPWSSIAAGAWADVSAECSEATLDGWIADHRWHGAGGDAAWLDSAPMRAPLKSAGVHVLPGIEASKPFAVVDVAGSDCVVALSETQEELSVREAGGARRIAHARGALAWCSSTPETVSVWRVGKGPVVILAASSARIGGLLGTRECLGLAGIHVAADATWLRDGDLAWEATTVLRASGLAGAKTAELPAEPGPTTTDVTALVRSPATRVAAEPAGVVVACDPGLDLADERSIVCASAGPVSWWRRGDAPGAVARAPLPFWLSQLETHHEPDAIARIPELLSLARLLARDGFEPTVLEGVTELPEGVRVVGRAGEDAMVAVGLLPKAPWVIPYTDGVAWDLGDTPRIVALQPGLAVKLVASPPPNSPPDKRRTIVFRRSSKPR